MIARAQIEQWWVSGDGVGGLWWVGITGTSDKEAAHRALLIEQNVALFREFSARADNLLHLRNTGRFRASPLIKSSCTFSSLMHKIVKLLQ